MDIRKIVAAVLAVLCVGFSGCTQEKVPEPTAPSREDKPIMSITTQPTESTDGTSELPYTPVYATAFGDTIYLATVPIDGEEGREPSCAVREVSMGGQIHCGQIHEVELERFVITRVVIAEDLYPKATSDWFRGLTDLVTIDGLERLHTDGVTDMSHMFAGCASLSTLEAEDWEVSGVEDMTGIFDGCDALAVRPDWYQPE